MKNNHLHRSPRYSKAFTLLEIMIAVAIIGILISIAVPAFQSNREVSDNIKAVQDIIIIGQRLDNYYANNGSFPANLATIDLDGKVDPWGNSYMYLNLMTLVAGDKPRKDGNLKPVNSDYDLFSRGKDGNFKPTFSAGMSQDDIARANNGDFVGIVADY